jgi:hypothetical protein
MLGRCRTTGEQICSMQYSHSHPWDKTSIGPWTENFPNLEKTMPIQVQEASKTPNTLDQNNTTPQHIIIKTTNTEYRERMLKAVREKKQITYKGKPMKITDFSTETLKARRA